MPRRARQNGPQDPAPEGQDSGDLAPPPRQTSLEDVCRALDVSTATVSRVLNNRPGVSAALRQKVLAAIKEMNYVPKAAARNLSRARSDTLGVVFQDLTPGWLLTVFRGIMMRAGGNYHVILSLSTRPGDEFELAQRMLAERRVDGLIWYDARVTPKLVREVKRQPVPFVLVQNWMPDSDVSSVCIDCTEGSRDAVRHLLALGYRNLVIVTGPEGNADSDRKMLGVNQALSEAGVRVPPANILPGHHVGHQAIAVMKAYLESRPLPEAVFAFNDTMALALLGWLRERGIRVPEEVAIVGFDGTDDARKAGLTTIETPMHELGVLTVQTLIERIEEPNRAAPAHQILLRGALAVRDTCGARLRASR